MSGPTKLPPRPKAASLFMAVPIVFLGASDSRSPCSLE